MMDKSASARISSEHFTREEGLKIFESTGRTVERVGHEVYNYSQRSYQGLDRKKAKEKL